MTLSTKPYKGTRDFYPEDMAFRKWMFSHLKSVVESYGYNEYEGPMLESFELYAAKTGEEIVNSQIYHFEDRGQRKVAMRPEMTPTMARMVAGRIQELAKPIRWYSLPNLWRYERPQRGRLREHWQLNVDLLGGERDLADKEIIKIAFELIKKFKGQEHIKIHINNRKLVNSFFNDHLGLNTEQALQASKAIDAKDKTGPDKFNQSLKDMGLNENQITKLSDFFNSSLDNLNSKYPSEGATELADLFNSFKNSEVFEKIIFDPSIMRGLDYYTGTVFEVYDTSPENNRAMFGGGRYDNLIGLFGKHQISGIGFGMGDVTLENFINTHGLACENTKPSVDAFFVLPHRKHMALMDQLIEKVQLAGLSTATSLDTGKLGAQLKVANKYNARFAVILGDDEVSTQQVSVKNLLTGEQVTVSFDGLTKALN